MSIMKSLYTCLSQTTDNLEFTSWIAIIYNKYEIYCIVVKGGTTHEQYV